MVAAAVAGAAIVGAAASESSADTQANALRHASHTQQNTFNTINQQEQPYIQSGYGAQNALNSLLGTGGPTTGPDGKPLPGADFANTSGLGAGYLTHQFDTQDFYNNVDPGYQFQLQQGQQAVRNASTPGVGALSGPALKELINYNQGLAGTSYQNAFNRYTTQQNNIFGRLSQIAGLGQNAATQVGNQATQLGTGIAQAQAAGGAAQAAGIVGVGNSISSGIQLAGLLNNSNSAYGGQAPQQATLAGAAGEASS